MTASKPAFNLLDEPWIPIRSLAGEVREVSLSDALLRAGEYAALAETAPPNLIALYRLLLAALHRALVTHHGQWKDSDRARWFREGLPEAPIRAYLEQWRDRFWLFHPEHPFMQVAALAEAKETRDKLKSWTQISLEGANGNTPVMFDHALDDAPVAITAAAACRNLLGFLQFTPGGLVKTFRDADKAGPLANTAAVVPTGGNLGQTLVLGLHPFEKRTDDLPAWEHPAPGVDDLRADPILATGPNDRYSRLSRAVLLLPDSDSNSIRYIRFGAGLALEEDVNAPDPMACYRISKEGKAIRISFTEGRSIWRDLPSLVPDAAKASDLPAAVLSWAANLYAALGQWDTPVQVLVAGLASDQAKLLRWRADRLELPRALLTDPSAAAELREQVRFAEEVYFKLRRCCSDMVAAIMPDPDNKDTKSRARTILENSPVAPVFFSVAERALPGLMQQIASGDTDTAHPGWRAALKHAAEQAWDATRHSLGSSPAVLRAEARTWPRFRILLRSLEQSEPGTEFTQEEVTA
jgi:CRISPR system Cascade subunit CasA